MPVRQSSKTPQNNSVLLDISTCCAHRWKGVRAFARNLVYMEVDEITYGRFEELRIPAAELIRAFRNWRAFAGEGLEGYLIVIDDFEQRRAIVFTYRKRDDRDADVELLRRLRDDGSDA